MRLSILAGFHSILEEGHKPLDEYDHGDAIKACPRSPNSFSEPVNSLRNVRSPQVSQEDSYRFLECQDEFVSAMFKWMSLRQGGCFAWAAIWKAMTAGSTGIYRGTTAPHARGHAPADWLRTHGKASTPWAPTNVTVIF
jgi:hypothetical protein